MTIDLFLLRTALRDVLRPKRLTAAILLVLLPAAIALLWRGLVPAKQFAPGDAYNSLAASLVFGFILTILSVIYGTGVVSQEMEQRTIVYLLTRPVPRWRILLAKFRRQRACHHDHGLLERAAPGACFVRADQSDG
jgi:ABC-2 type transport system permease protein